MNHLERIDEVKKGIFSIASTSNTSTTHQHRLGQLSSPESGIMYLIICNRIYVVTPANAVYIPAGVAHAVYKIDPSTVIKNIFFNPVQFNQLPVSGVHLFSLTKLASLVMSRLCEVATASRVSNLLNVLFDELETTPNKALYNLLLPENEKLSKIFQHLLSDQDQYSRLEWCAQSVCMSSRSLQRLIKKELGISFVLWRQQINYMKAIELLAVHKKTSIVAYKLGYNSESAFITMFKKFSGLRLPSQIGLILKENTCDDLKSK